MIEGCEKEQEQGHEIPKQLPVSWVDLSEIDQSGIKKRMIFFEGEEYKVERYWKYTFNAVIDFYEGGS